MGTAVSVEADALDLIQMPQWTSQWTSLGNTLELGVIQLTTKSRLPRRFYTLQCNAYYTRGSNSTAIT